MGEKFHCENCGIETIEPIKFCILCWACGRDWYTREHQPEPQPEPQVQAQVQVSGRVKTIWRAVALSWIAKLIGCGGMVVTRRVVADLPRRDG